MEDRSTKTIRRIGAISTFLFFFVLAIQNPAAIYAGNREEFILSVLSDMLLLVPAFLVCALIFLVPILALRGLALRIYTFIALVAALASWTYSNLVLLDFGVLDGQQWRFDFPATYRTLEIAAIGGACIALAWLLTNRPKVVQYFMVVLSSAVLVSSIVDILSAPRRIRMSAIVDGTPIYRFSSEKNLLIVLMDAFQSDIFADLARDDPNLKAQFDGFTFFPDTLGTARTTYLTMPSIHSGAEYEKGTLLADSYEEHVRRGSFMNALADEGYEAILVSPPSFGCPEKSQVCVGIEPILRSQWSVTLHEVAKLLDLSLFRAVPLRYKEWVYNEGNWHLGRRYDRYNHFVILANRLLEVLAQRAVVQGDIPTVKFFHLLNTHPPFVLNADCSFTGQGATHSRERMTIQAGCAIRAFVGLLDRLKTLNIYDRTVIMLIADTGSGARNLGSSYMGDPDQVSYAGAGLVGAANPLLLVKPLGAHGPLEISNASVQISDIAATACDLLGDCSGFRGVSVFQAPESKRRRRLYNDFLWKNEFIWSRRIPGLVQHYVEGPLWDLESWPRRARPILRLGKVIDFTPDGHSAVYRGYGWDVPGKWGAWTNGDEAALSFERSGDVDRDLTFFVSAEAKIDGTHPKQEVDVYVNDLHLDTWVYRRPGVLEQRKVVVPRDLIAQRDRLEVEFKMRSPYRISRESRRGIIRQRAQGIRVRKLGFQAVPGV